MKTDTVSSLVKSLLAPYVLSCVLQADFGQRGLPSFCGFVMGTENKAQSEECPEA